MSDEIVNKIINIKRDDLKAYMEGFEVTDTTLVVELEGSETQSVDEYFTAMEEECGFPWACEGIWARYLDFMTDFCWLIDYGDKSHSKNINIFVVIIKDYSKFMVKDKIGKKNIIETFKTHILPFWEKDVIRITVGGVSKSFNVFLVD